jgi:two-component system, response regulator PdtaR
MKNRKILIVEDEALTAMLMEMDLRELGYTVLKPVATGEEAIDRVAIEHPDLVLMDINLAGVMDGFEAAKEIRKYQAVPIIFLSGYSGEEVMERSRELQALAFLVKPVRMGDIVTIFDSGREPL